MSEKELSTRPARRRHGFVLAELAAVAAVLAVAVCLAAVATRQSRMSAGLAGSLANLKKLGETTGNYAADFDDHLWSFSWSVGDAPSQYPDLQSPHDPTEALGFQATDIARRLFDETLPPLDDRLPVAWLSTLVLVEYLGESLPAEWAVSPGDEVRLGWRKDPHDPPMLYELGGEAWAALFAPFGSSYMLMPAFVAPDEREGRNLTLLQYGGHHDWFSVPSSLLFGRRRVSEIRFPSAKVHMAERASYFFGPRPAYFLHREGRVPMLMADGSVAVHATADANASFLPNDPDDTDRVTATRYTPNALYDVPTFSGGEFDLIDDCTYKWTRGGLRGIDFNGERAE